MNNDPVWWKTLLKTAFSQAFTNISTVIVPPILASVATLWTVVSRGHTITPATILECFVVLIIIGIVIFIIKYLLTLPRVRYTILSFNLNPYEGVWIERYSMTYNIEKLDSVSVFYIYSDATKTLKIYGKVFLVQTGEHFSNFSGEVINQVDRHMVYKYKTNFMQNKYFVKGSHNSAEGFGIYDFHPSPPGNKFIGFATGEFVELIGAEAAIRPHSATQVEHIPPPKVHNLIGKYYPAQEGEYRLLARGTLKPIPQDIRVPAA